MGLQRSKLIGTIHRDQRTDRRQASVSFGKAWTVPNVSEQHVIGELRQLRIDVAEQGLGSVCFFDGPGG
jgi:hypothetical protein